ncbi:hypothetical protein [Marisediminitalea sp.]|jgi:cation transport ATPase|uniref:hypothetical protein n=1 Tax=Marisediminitalea sp. TaxID=2662268 RepID=UPI00351871D4
MQEHDTNNVANAPSQPEQKKRGFWLTAFLILMFIANPLTAFMYFSAPDLIVSTQPKATIGIVYALGVMSVINFAIAVGIWSWKKYAVYGMYASVAIAFVINIYLGIGIVGALFGLLGGLLIFLTTRNRWQWFS